MVAAAAVVEAVVEVAEEAVVAAAAEEGSVDLEVANEEAVVVAVIEKLVMEIGNVQTQTVITPILLGEISAIDAMNLSQKVLVVEEVVEMKEEVAVVEEIIEDHHVAVTGDLEVAAVSEEETAAAVQAVALEVTDVDPQVVVGVEEVLEAVEAEEIVDQEVVVVQAEEMEADRVRIKVFRSKCFIFYLCIISKFSYI